MDRRGVEVKVGVEEPTAPDVPEGGPEERDDIGESVLR